ncbi:hypothetical protein VaNZ11_005111 [Volvox africanus]|uniref:VDE lipocalin domain-containing protein n=1 Tax=Volvox africanus TaxID=51714 RepID=A0ABQ5RY87_9CHLO|nr:hypothetical protein VaNZ11_005111 [Volvox africanus]
MFLASRQGLAGKLSNNDEATKTYCATHINVSKQKRTCLTDRNTLGGTLGVRKQSSVERADAENEKKNELTSYAEIKPRMAGINCTDGGCGSLASHEVLLSDNSDSDELKQGIPHDSSRSTPCKTSQNHEQQQQLHGSHGQGRHDEKLPSNIRRTSPGPAAALSRSAVSMVRRRLKQKLPYTVAVVAMATPLPPPPPLLLPLPPPPPAPQKPTVTVTAAPPVQHQRHARHTWGMRRTAAMLVTVLLATAAAVVGLRVMLSSNSRSSTRGAEGSGSGGGISVVSAATGGRATNALPYMAGWARHLGILSPPTTAAGTAAALHSSRSSVITAALSPSVRGRTDSSTGSSTRNGGIVSPLLRRWQWYGGSGQMATVTAGAAPRHDETMPSTSSTPAAAGGHGSDSSPRMGEGSSGTGAVASAGRPPQPQDYEWRESAAVRVITVVHEGAPSPYRTSWDSLADHTAQRFEWMDPAYQMMVFRMEQLAADRGIQGAFLNALEGGAQVVVGLNITDEAAEAFFVDPRVRSKLPNVVLFVDGSETLSAELTQLQSGLRPQDSGSWRTALARRLPWTPDGKGLEVWDTVQQLLRRHDSDNFLFVYLVLVNQFVTTVRQVAETTKGFDLQSIICMAKNCGSKVVGCVQDTTCKSVLDCLQACSFNDQVCQYRCIVSYESPLLEQFSLCILQLHNCRNLDAKPPLLPDPAPMPSFRGVPLTHGTAEELFFGWLDEPGQGAPRSIVLGDRTGKPYSWLVAAGKNPAYDYFPCQHQLYYRGRGRGQVWYEPVFKVVTLDGREVWRRRVYRVRRGKVPGTFHLSVLDNGVTSNEFWRILDCDEDLSFCLFYYSGAASAAGLSYSGAVLGTPDGHMPGPQHTERLNEALRRAGIEPWELSYVKNDDCADAPLRITGPVAAPAPAA